MTKWLFNEWEQGKDNAHSRCNTRVDCRCRLYLHMLPAYYQYFVGIFHAFSGCITSRISQKRRCPISWLKWSRANSSAGSDGATVVPEPTHGTVVRRPVGLRDPRSCLLPEKWAFKQRTWRCQEQIWKSSRKIWGYMGMFFTMTSCFSMATISNTTTPTIFKH